MNVYRLTVRYPHEGTENLIDYYSNFDVASNAAEIHAEEEFEVDDAEFGFATSFVADGDMYSMQDFPPELKLLHVNDPRQPSERRATYTIQEIEVKELA